MEGGIDAQLDLAVPEGSVDEQWAAAEPGDLRAQLRQDALAPHQSSRGQREVHDRAPSRPHSSKAATSRRASWAASLKSPASVAEARDPATPAPMAPALR